MKYDIFISYRREGGYDTAKHLNDLLVRDGYRVSFDIDTLRNGDFDTQLLSRIEECRDFILIVDQHAFDRTLDPEFDPKKDWLRCELAHALKHNKNIIPVFLSGVIGFPDGLPSDIANVTKKNGPEYNRYYFNDFYETLKKRFLHKRSKYRIPLIIVPVLFFVTLILFISKVYKVEKDINYDKQSIIEDGKQSIINEYDKRQELPIQERADIVDVVNSFIIDDLTKYNIQGWSVFKDYTKKHQLIPLTDGIEWVDETNNEYITPFKLDFVSKLVYKNRNFDEDMFGNAKIQHITLMGPRAGAILLSISSGHQATYEMDTDFIMDIGFSNMSDFSLDGTFYCIAKKDEYCLVEVRSGGSGGNFYEWIISMDLDLINDYLHVYHYTPEQCNIFEVKDGENLTSSYLKYQ